MKNYEFYKGKPREECVKTRAELKPLTWRDRQDDAKLYNAGPALAAAVNVALLLGRPLLVTGEPGTGKTQLAYSLRCELGFEVYRFDTKSTSTARDLFYRYDTLGSFHAAQFDKERFDPLDFIDYDALGAAILLSRHEEEVREWLPPGFRHTGKQRSIVLIDEIDKAPRDFPNDLLSQIEELYFKVPELGRGNKKIEADRELRPIVIITSNSEKSLPDAFLRRCVFYDIPFPGAQTLKDIALTHLRASGGTAFPWLDDALTLFERFRRSARDLEKVPATAELLDWLQFLRKKLEHNGSSGDLRNERQLLGVSISALLKSAADHNTAERILNDWFQGADT